ncbi:hypothetical protein CBER1_03902 [Cercospora berteroae]|uniref:Uncharacterized protein n=1 Tax=Cercospora berteroae TaxID=357750 RepID=A0A2S6CA44_9PEZI|nr:hypothetical protein CBER1_03902 [Cercospora berteroae]
MATDGSDTDEEPREHASQDPVISIRVTAPSGQPTPRRQLETHRSVPGSVRDRPSRRDTQPIDPVERIEEYYSVHHEIIEEQSTAKPREKRSEHTGEKGAPKLIIEEKRTAARKPDPEHGPGAAPKTRDPHISFVQPLNRRTNRQYPDSPPQDLHGRRKPDQSSDEMLDDYYDGFDDTLFPRTTSMGMKLQSESEHEPVGFEPPPPPPPRPPQSTVFPNDMPPDNPFNRPPYTHELPGRHGRRHKFIDRAPHRTAIWDRAAVRIPQVKKYDILLKLVLTRHGERYSGENFPYRSGTWTDVVFARKLNQQYRNLKTAKVGIVQKLTAYKKISFVYFVQFHAFPDVRYGKTGAWLRTARQPITFRDNAMTRNSFMNQLQRMCRKKSILYSMFTGKPSDRDERPPIRWVSRLDSLIEKGAVIDIDVQETFDSSKIYMGLMLAIMISLGAALGYGFAMDNDFSTGFSIASWVITALGFLAAVIAAGEYFGLDSPKATLMEVDGYDRPYR